MHTLSLVSLLALLAIGRVSAHPHLFFLHNRFIEEYGTEADHPDHGNGHYREILVAFRAEGFIVHSEKRPPGTDVHRYARRIAAQADSLLACGVLPGDITIVGTSKGGYIAQYVSTYLANPAVNFVFIGCYRDADLQQLDDIDWCGNILTIYEASDPYGVSALDRKLSSRLEIRRFHEVELRTGLGHGFLFRPLDDWIRPTALWARQRYSEVGVNAVPFPVLVDTTIWADTVRGRTVPLAIYRPDRANGRSPVVIFSHGYWANEQGAYLAYDYLTEFLASRGYFVVSIQHELPTDSLMPSAGVSQIVRRPFWERGADNIRFVLVELAQRLPELDLSKPTLIGHSNGGDMVALFAERYPGVARKIVTLDNRRMPLPRDGRAQVLSLRSSDQPADPGVLPPADEQAQLGMHIVRLLGTHHDEMDDTADASQRSEIRSLILQFLETQ